MKSNWNTKQVIEGIGYELHMTTEEVEHWLVRDWLRNLTPEQRFDLLNKPSNPFEEGIKLGRQFRESDRELNGEFED